jgi:hypothetical protein
MADHAIDGPPESSPSVSKPPRIAPFVVCVAGVATRNVRPLADDPPDQEDGEEQHHERNVEHPDGRDDLPHRAQDPVGEVEEDPIHPSQARPWLHREPRQHGPEHEHDEEDDEDRTEDGVQHELAVVQPAGLQALLLLLGDLDVGGRE